MPRKKCARRFDPRFGVSQTMLEAECRHVGYELEDYLLLSMNGLRTKLLQLQKQVATLEEELQTRLSKTPDRERLALRCMLARDFWHIVMLYRKLLTSQPMIEATGPIGPSSSEMTSDGELVPVLSFAKTLFD